MTNPNIGQKIIEHCHKQGIRFSFDSECDVLKCKRVVEWEQEITHPKEGKMVINLCEKHMQDFDNDVSFEVVKKVQKSKGEKN